MIQPPIRSASGARGTTAPTLDTHRRRESGELGRPSPDSRNDLGPNCGCCLLSLPLFITLANHVSTPATSSVLARPFDSSSHARATLLAEFWRTLRSRSATLLVDQF
ncbi:hypothetical protein CGGC5_v009351 [Colletotrichum fructicola Nara gc5]|uniref:Uncharacterized protein n=1 Tax=Colletotrichum fructicola (strain Nara gc5) TaxID=1213859 RepID=A0A7J6J4G6_COLFN|nr:hypothetical protein CGGC5_v009351 [Colletotrichum fructicola Nara gc5]